MPIECMAALPRRTLSWTCRCCIYHALWQFPTLTDQALAFELGFRLMEFEAGLPLWHMTLGKGTDFLVYKVECVSHICLVSQSEGLMNCVV